MGVEQEGSNAEREDGKPEVNEMWDPDGHRDVE